MDWIIKYLTAMQALGFAAQAHGQIGSATLHVESNVKNVKISASPLGSTQTTSWTAGTPQTLPPGIYNLTLNATGFVPRTVRVELSGEKLRLAVNLRRPNKQAGTNHPMPNPKQPQKGDPARPASPIVEGPSVCQALKSEVSPKKSSGEPIPCLRTTWTDDYTFSLSLYFSNSVSDFTGLSIPLRGRFRQLEEQIMEGFSRSDLMRLEYIQAEAPDHKGGYEVLSQGWVGAKDCNRSLVLIEEAENYGFLSPLLTLTRVLCSEESEGMEATKRQLVAIVQQRDSPPMAYFHLGRLNILTGKGSTEKILGACIHRFPAYYPCHHLLASFLVKSGRGEAAQKTLQAYMDTSRRNLEFLSRTVFRMLRSGDTRSAQGLLSKALADHPQRFEFNWLQMLLLLKQEKNANLDQFYQRIPFTRIERPIMARRLIDFTYDEGFKDAAISGYTAMLRLNPKEGYYHWKKAHVEQEAGRCEDAIKTVDAAPLGDRQIALPLLGIRAECLMTKQDFSAAIATYERMIELAPKEWRYHYNMGILHDKLGSQGDAQKAYQAALSLNPPAEMGVRIRRLLKEP